MFYRVRRDPTAEKIIDSVQLPATVSAG